ncbi:MAG: thioesterase II family protein [Flammeovirgaceae bacterium]
MFNKTTILAFHFGGGSKYSFRALEKLLPKAYHWKTVELPGRGDKIGEPLLDDVHEMVEAIYDEVVEIAQKGEYIMYGHSMGTLIGFELMRKMVASNAPLPLFLFFTGRGAPAVEREKKLSSLKKDIFWKEIQAIGGLPAEVFEHEDLMDFFEPILRSDFKALEDYQYRPLKEPFRIPIYIRVGTEEELTPEKIQAWQDESVFPLNQRKMKGNHFFIFDDPQGVLDVLIEAHHAVLKMKVMR